MSIAMAQPRLRGRLAALDLHPEWWALALAALAWAQMLGHGLAHGGCACQDLMSPGDELVAWMGMVVAMMVPTLTEGVRDMSLRSYRFRRRRAIASYLLGYLTCWVIAGIPAVALRQWPAAHDGRAAAVAFAAAAAWTLLPLRRRWQLRCHRRIPLTPIGARADLDSFCQGVANGVPCVAMCWPLMLACTLTGHSLVAMLASAILTLKEKQMFRPRPRPIALAMAGLTLWTFVRAI
jgi:predicted metal-binding membrane protein